MEPMRWVLQHKMPIVLSLGIIVLIVAGIWFWGVLVGYINPGAKGATDRKDVVQAFALIVAGVVAAIGGIVGIVNLQTSRRNLQQQRDLEEQRAQEDALQSYFEQMGDLLTDHNLINTDREDIRQLAQAQTLTVLARLDGYRKGSVVRFLHGAGLIHRDQTIVALGGADLTGTILIGANITNANLSGAYLADSYLMGTILIRANLSGVGLSDANLPYADLSGANLSDASGITNEELEQQALSLEGATMPNSQKYEEWIKDRLKDKEGRGEDGKNSGP
jgi:uncharacterized protein YjbI with pentapeptide repeats